VLEVKGYDSTCVISGLTDGKKCADCEEFTVMQNVISKKSHTQAVDSPVPPTCTQNGLTSGTYCSACKTVISKPQPVPATGHIYSAWATVDGKPVKQCGNSDCTSAIDVANLSVEYLGKTLLTGEEVNTEDISVTVYLSNGETEKVDVFSLENPVIAHGGNNEITIVFGSIKTSVYVPAIYSNLPDTNSVNDFEYVKNSNSITITKYIGKDTDVVIPAHIGRVPVTNLAKEAFYGSAITSVIIPGNVETIGEGCFAGCSSLSSVTLSEGIKTIYGKAFYGCPITSIVIPDSVTSIQHYYKYNSGYGSTTIYGAFENCKKLTSVVIGKGLTDIAPNTFYGCSALASVIIGDSVKTIGESAFYNCSALTSVTIGSGVTNLKKNAFYGCASLVSIDIPGNVEEIGENCFVGCSSLTSVTLNEGLKTIKAEAFHGCPITSIVIPDSVTSIQHYYKYNPGYGSTTIYGAFQGCNKLTSIVIGKGLKSIVQNTFYGCTAITSVHYNGTEEEWASVTVAEGNTNLKQAAFTYGN
jgi:hypothetical protein